MKGDKGFSNGWKSPVMDEFLTKLFYQGDTDKSM